MRILSKILTILFLISFKLNGQDLELIKFPPYIETTYQTSKAIPVEIANYSDKSQKVSISIENNLLIGGSSAQLCYNGNCSQGKLLIEIDPQSTLTNLTINFIAGITEIKGVISLKIQNLETKNELFKDLNIKVSDYKIEEILFSKGDLVFNNFYPNPAKDYAKMQYNYNKDNAKIILQNVLGGVVKEYMLDPNKNQLSLETESLNPGIYFYTLFISDEGIATKKLVVKK